MGRPEYAEWVKEQKEPSYPVYIITGAHHWKKEFMASLKELYDTDYTMVNKSIRDDLKKLNYRPLGKKKHLVMYESVDRMTKEDLTEILQYVKQPSKYGIFILSVNTWAEKKEIMKNFRYLDNSKTIKYFELDFPRREFIVNYIRDTCYKYELVFENLDAFNYLVRRISNSTQDVVDSIQTLSTLGIKLDKESITAYTEDYSSYNYDKLYSSLAKLDRKKIPFIAYNDLLDSGKRETSIMINIRKHFHYLYQAKYLKLMGILRNDDIIDLKKHLYDKAGLTFKDNNIFDLSDYKINYYLKESDYITLKEIIQVMSTIDKNMGYVTERATGIDSTGTTYNMDNSEIDAFKTILEILTRRT